MTHMAPSLVLVVGAGLAGLSTGIHLLERAGGALKVRVLDRGHVLGGKASSKAHTDEAGRRWTVDHGFHVFFDYPNLGARLRELGADVRLTPARHEVLIWSPTGVRRFRARNWPSPLHLLTGGIESGLYGMAEGLRILAFLTDLLSRELGRLSADERAALDETSFDELARRAGLSTEILASPFFRFISQSAFIYPHQMSALSAIAAIQLVARDYDAVACRYLDGGCSTVVVDPLVKRFRQLGGEIVPFQRAVRLRVVDGRVAAVAVRENRHYIHAAEDGSGRSNYHSPEPPPADPLAGAVDVTADWYVSALPPRDLMPVLEPASAGLDYFTRIGKLQTQRTIALTLWLDRLVSPPDANGAIIGVPGPFSTVADLARLQTHPEGRGSVIQFVGEEGAFAGAPDDQVVAAGRDALARLWPASLTATVDRQYFHRGGHDAFFLTTPGADALRPTPASPHPNLVLAGDFVRNGVDVICMEGAFVSGIRAANEILARAGLPTAPVLPARAPGLVMGALRRARRLEWS